MMYFLQLLLGIQDLVIMEFIEFQTLAMDLEVLAILLRLTLGIKTAIYLMFNKKVILLIQI
jgi:hypothetical protein